MCNVLNCAHPQVVQLPHCSSLPPQGPECKWLKQINSGHGCKHELKRKRCRKHLKHQTEWVHNCCLREYPLCQSAVVDVSECRLHVFTSVKCSFCVQIWGAPPTISYHNIYIYIISCNVDHRCSINFICLFPPRHGHLVDSATSSELLTSSENFTCWRMDSTSKQVPMTHSMVMPKSWDGRRRNVYIV